MSNTDWVEANLVRQRKMLEEKQRAKRAATTTNVSAVPTAALRSDYVFADPFSTSPPMCFDGPLAFSTGDPDRFGSRSSNLSVVSGMTRNTSAGKVTEKKNFVCEFDEDELATRMEKADLSTVVMSDDDDLDGDGQAAVDPSKDGVEYTTLPHDDAEPDYEWITKNIDRFVEEPAKAGSVYRCLITRDKRGVDKGMYPTYYLHLDGGERHKKIFLLAARKRKKCKTANYLISTDATDLTRDGGSFVGKVRSNAMGTQFTLYDNGKNPTKSVSVDVRQELAAVLYETNVLGFKGPRKMTILIPGVTQTGDTVSYKRLRIQPVDDKDSLIERHRRARSQNDQNQNQVVVMQNKPPIWNDDTQSYVLNFHGRVQVASVKNFQIVHMQDPDYIVMQFGRRSDEQFAMDFRYPLSALQAFGIAMTSFHGKLACE